MNRLTHILALTALAGGALVGSLLWARWGAQVWLSDFIAWCT